MVKILIIGHFHHLCGHKRSLLKQKTGWMKLFGMKFTLFGNRRDIVYVWNLISPIIGCTLIAHGKICVQKRLNYCFSPLPFTLLWEILYFSFQTQMEVCKQMWGVVCKGKGYGRPFEPWGFKVMGEWTHGLSLRAKMFTHQPIYPREMWVILTQPCVVVSIFKSRIRDIQIW